MYTKIAGISFEGRQEHIKALQVGQELLLLRDPQNEYDPNAVKVQTKEGLQLGFLSRELAEQFAPAMDKGMHYSCRISSITGEGKPNHGVNIEINQIEELDAANKIYCMTAIGPGKEWNLTMKVVNGEVILSGFKDKKQLAEFLKHIATDFQ